MAFALTQPSGYSALGGTWDPASLPADMALSNGNLTVTKASDDAAWTCVRNLTPIVGSVKRYVEHNVTGSATDGFLAGFGPSGMTNANAPGLVAASAAYSGATPGQWYVSNSVINTGLATIGLNSPVGFAIDWGGQKIYVQIALNTWVGLGGTTANPVTGTNGIPIGLSSGTAGLWMLGIFNHTVVVGTFTGATVPLAVTRGVNRRGLVGGRMLRRSGLSGTGGV